MVTKAERLELDAKFKEDLLAYEYSRIDLLFSTTLGRIEKVIKEKTVAIKYFWESSKLGTYKKPKET